MLHCFYRISDNGYKKPKLEFATKYFCLRNFVEKFQQSNKTIFVDGVSYELQEFIDEMQLLHRCNVVILNTRSNAGSWRHVRDYALTLPDDDIVYFVEDDYIHLNNSEKCLLEGIQWADYVSLYDCNDKYEGFKYRNPFVQEGTGGEPTRVIVTESRHWRLTNSTTMTFAARVKTLREDKDIWDKHTEGNHPNDFPAFLELRAKGRSLITPIPSLSTHTEPDWLAPIITMEQWRNANADT